MVICTPLSVTVPPKVAGSVKVGQSLLLTVALRSRPVSLKPCRLAGATENAGSPNVGMTHGDTAFFGGFAVPPWPCATPVPNAITLAAAIKTTSGPTGDFRFRLAFISAPFGHRAGDLESDRWARR